jgi:hypothetical protein
MQSWKRCAETPMHPKSRILPQWMSTKIPRPEAPQPEAPQPEAPQPEAPQPEAVEPTPIARRQACYHQTTSDEDRRQKKEEKRQGNASHLIYFHVYILTPLFLICQK